MIARFEGRKVLIELSEAKDKRSSPQNRFRWKIVVAHVVEMFAEAGTTITPQKAHDYLKTRVLGSYETIIDLDGRPAIIPGSTTELSKKEFADAILKVQVWAKEFDWDIPTLTKEVTISNKSCKRRLMTKVGNIAADQLRSYIERIERLEEEKAGIASDIKDVFAEAKGNGVDTKTMREVIKLRRMEAAERDELDHMLDLYLVALGMASGFGQAA